MAKRPTIVRVPLRKPDAVIVRWHDGEMYVVADTRLSDARIAELTYEARHCRDGRPFGARAV